jgi:uncharacterized RDD family membrane protein YckC
MAADKNEMTNPYAPPRAAVQDLRDPSDTMVPADRGTRLGATILDSIIFAGMVYGPIIIMAIVLPAFVTVSRARGMSDVGTVFLIVGGLFALGGLATWIVFTVKYVNENGQSIAKRMLGIKVVRADGSPITLGRIFWMRNFLNTLISFIPLYGLVDALFILGESRQCLHDKLADTIVVRA